MRKSLAIGTAAVGGLGLVLATLGAGMGAGADSPSPAIRVTLAGLAADGNAASPSSPVTAPSGQVATVRVGCYRDGDGIVRVVGEVSNGLDRPAANVQLAASLIAAGETVASGSGYALLPSISGGRVSPFEIVLPAPSPVFDGCQVSVTQYATENNMPQIPYSLDVSLGVPWVDSAGATHVPGTVRNRSGQGWRFVRVYVVLTDESGKVRLVATTEARPGEISSGLQSSFDAVFPVDVQLPAFGMQGFVWAELPQPTPTPSPTRTGGSQTPVSGN